MDFFMLLIGFLLLVLTAFSPSISICFIQSKKLKSKLKFTLIITLSILQLWICYCIKNAIYPDDSFYIQEYLTVIGKATPKSAIIINKSASYPDIHGGYISASLIKFSQSDFDNLYQEINKNNAFEKGEIINSETLKEIINDKKYFNDIIWKQRKISDKNLDYKLIGFLNIRKYIIIYHVKT